MTTNDLTYEAAYWGACSNTYDEESKHYTYATYMGIKCERFDFRVPDMTRIIDIGGGPASMLLKTVGRSGGTVLDPLLGTFPRWVRDRYSANAIFMMAKRGEDLGHDHFDEAWHDHFDEAWIYNVLQHTDDPELVVRNARRVARIVRIFEWVGIPAYEGHPHTLDANELAAWFGVESAAAGRARMSVNEGGAVGNAFAGAFRS